jgi:DNA repair/transcription protein MET18/MMS19
MKLFSIVLTRLEVDLGRADGKLQCPIPRTLLIFLVHTFVEYFCGRLENKHDIANFGAGIKETAISLQALASMTARFPRGDASAVAKAVFSMPSATFTAQLASTRLSLFELLDYLFSTYSATITRDMGADTFVSGLVSMAEFEKDPRCLTVLFQMYAQISESWKLNAKSFKAIWDSYCRYFPISLKSTDPSVPTREELQQLLLQCFTSHDDYAVYAIPHLFDALDTTQDTLTASVKVTSQNLEVEYF